MPLTPNPPALIFPVPAKRKPIRAAVATKAKAATDMTAALERRSAAKAKKAAEPPVPMVTSACHFQLDVLALLKRVATERAIRYGGRTSVSALINELVLKHRAELSPIPLERTRWISATDSRHSWEFTVHRHSGRGWSRLLLLGDHARRGGGVSALQFYSGNNSPFASVEPGGECYLRWKDRLVLG